MNLVNGDMSQMAEFGKNLVALGKALQKPNTRLDKLAVLALRCGMGVRFGFCPPGTADSPSPEPEDAPE